jgi:hypothetical protein
MAKLDPKPFNGGLPNHNDFKLNEVPPGYKSWMEVYDAQDKKLQELLAASEKVDYRNPKGSLKGAVIAFPRGDGSAYYIVTKDRPLTVAHIPFCDAWTTDWPTINGVTAGWIRQTNGQD